MTTKFVSHTDETAAGNVLSYLKIVLGGTNQKYTHTTDSIQNSVKWQNGGIKVCVALHHKPTNIDPDKGASGRILSVSLEIESGDFHHIDYALSVKDSKEVLTRIDQSIKSARDELSTAVDVTTKNLTKMESLWLQLN